MQGFAYPQTPTGNASILPPTPWHYSGQLLTIEYRVSPDLLRTFLPESFELADEDPGALALIWADWQSCGNDFAEVLDPVRMQYMETFLVMRCQFRKQTYSRCLFIWVDKDYAMIRGLHQGYPKKLGSIHLTRPVRVGRVGPKMQDGKLITGGKFGATLAANDRRLAEATFTVTGESPNTGFVNALPMVHNRWMQRIESDGVASLDEIVTMRGFDADLGTAYKGTASLEFFPSPTEELTALAPQEIIGGFWREVGVSWKAGETLQQTAR
ncbi:MAG: acetoacetate decarboxylase family protein [Alphaproteobacteria bacterium]|nr:acetoacetate decarboxylase family protein [Alphaproteobacteria bacterium]